MKYINEDGSVYYGPPYPEPKSRTDTDLVMHRVEGKPARGRALFKGPFCGFTKRNGGLCHLPAGQGTDHKGYGFCRTHGGTRQTAKSLANKQNLAEGITYPGIKEEMARLSQDRDVFDMREHIFLLEAIAKTILNHAKTAEDLYPVMRVISEATKTIQRLDEIEHGRRLVIDMPQVNIILDRVVDIISRYVPDNYTKTLMAKDILAIPVGSTPRPIVPLLMADNGQTTEG